jgi:hypothetical protein
MNVFLVTLAHLAVPISLGTAGTIAVTGLLALAFERSRRKTCVAVLTAAPRGTLLIDRRSRGRTILVVGASDRYPHDVLVVDVTRGAGWPGWPMTNGRAAGRTITSAAISRFSSKLTPTATSFLSLVALRGSEDCPTGRC